MEGDTQKIDRKPQTTIAMARSLLQQEISRNDFSGLIRPDFVDNLIRVPLIDFDRIKFSRLRFGIDKSK